jgi:putative serine protease PepD
MSEPKDGRPPFPTDEGSKNQEESADYTASKNGQGGGRYVYDPHGTQDERPAGFGATSQQPTASYQQQATQSSQPVKPEDPTTKMPGVDKHQYGGANGPVGPIDKVGGPSAHKGKGGGPKRFLLGLLGGLIGAAALIGVLYFTGMIGKSSSTSNSNTTSSSQSITINTNDESTTTATAVASKCLSSVVSITVETSDGEALGSGVIYDTDGDIITNYHVIDGATSITVSIDGTTYDASVVGSDSSSDIAVIKADLNGASVTPIEVGDSDDLVVGDWVMTIGSPFGLDQSVSTGIVSALYRSTVLSSSSGNTVYSNLIQIDAAINQGNSGGALVNDKGQLVGINTLLESTSGDFSGIGFSIPGNYAVSIAKKIIAGETVTHAYIGLSMLTVNSQNAKTNNLSVTSGAYVAEVTDGGPADEAGIKQGDIITKVDDTTITSADGMIIAIRSHEEGDVVSVTFNRNGTEQTVQVTLGNDEALQEEEEQEEQQNSLLDQFGYNDNSNSSSSTNSSSGSLY